MLCLAVGNASGAQIHQQMVGMQEICTKNSSVDFGHHENPCKKSPEPEVHCETARAIRWDCAAVYSQETCLRWVPAVGSGSRHHTDFSSSVDEKPETLSVRWRRRLVVGCSPEEYAAATPWRGRFPPSNRVQYSAEPCRQTDGDTSTNQTVTWSWTDSWRAWWVTLLGY